MRLLLMGDLHIRLTNPKNRIDDYWSTMKRKLQFISNVFNTEHCDAIIQPGDFFDSFKANSQTKAEVILFLLTHFLDVPIITTYGQHDLKHHAQKENTPLAVLKAADLVDIVDYDNPLNSEDVHFYGSSWGEEIPEVKTDGVNILIIHAFVTEEPEIGIEKYYTTNNLLKTTNFNLIVSGDNHKSFLIKGQKGPPIKRYIVNCGSLMRSNISQKDHKPCIYTYDTDSSQLNQWLIPIDPFKEVMDIKRAEEIKEKNKSLDLFIETISKKVEIKGLNYLDNIKNEMINNALSELTKQKVKEAMGWRI